ncbi:MAG: T9SS type A sorting domain-containing protein [Prevotellaceae bacterium]|jgi:hypothetical protein|nr:T9SS type A sorting domain-containing protein [Prevotellaceae bacterium]
MKKIILFTSMLLSATGFGNKLFAFNGNGTEESPYLITSKADMEQLAADVDGGLNYSGVYFRLARNLTGSNDTVSTLVGNNTKLFCGVFDGDGHKIAVNRTGIFGRIENATIKNLGVVGKINAYAYYSDFNYYGYVGGICAVAQSSTISNCYNSAEISVHAAISNAQMFIGGITGIGSTITNCYNSGKIASSNASNSNSGGITGGVAEGIITNCYNTGDIAAAAIYSSLVGGITGTGGIVSNCYNSGKITAAATYSNGASGGICGTNGIGTITNCYNTGDIAASAAYAYSGGIAGHTGTIMNCYSIGNIAAAATNSSYSGGICGYMGTVGNCFVADVEITTDDTQSAGRIGDDDLNTYSNCYADNVSVFINGNPVSSTDKDGKNGEDIARANLQSGSWLTGTLEWDFADIWQITSDGTWPKLQNVSEANPEVPTYTLTLTSSNSDWGTIAANPAGPYTQGQQVVLTPAAANGYRFVRWHDNNLNNPRTVTVTGNMTFMAVFEANSETPTYTLTLTSNNSDWGTIAVNPAGPYTQGQQVVLTPAAANGYRFVRWHDNVSANPRIVTITGDMTFAAVFEADSETSNYTLTLASNDPNLGRVTVYPAGPYTYGQQVELTANAFVIYKFVRWKEDNSAENPHIVTVTGNMTFTALFALEMYRLTLTSNNPDWGTIVPSYTGPYTKEDQPVVLTAKAFSGYQFVRWDDNSSDSQRTVVVTDNMTFTAVFEKIPGGTTGSGTEADPYRISSKADMDELAGNVNGGKNYSGVYFRLTRDLTGANDTLTTVVGNSDDVYFSGIFDGDGHEIAVKRTGIFGQIRNATIKNLGVTGNIHTYVYSYENHYYAGGICATTENSTISNCYNNADIAASTAGAFDYQINTGGICGKTTNSYIINCRNTGSISSNVESTSYAGGIAGHYEVGGAITNCYNTGNIAAAAYDASYAGGICGFGGTITNCYNTGDISAAAASSPSYCGGISGEGGTITNCYNIGNIAASAAASSYSGGICGRNGIIANCFVAAMEITTDDVSRTYTGRIGGDTDSYYADCYADSVYVNGIRISNTGKNGKDGLDAKLANIQTRLWLTNTLGWNFTDNWSMTSDGTWPELQNVSTFFAVAGAVSKNSAGLGTVIVSHTIAALGEQVLFTATPADGCYFVRWEEDGNRENPRRIAVTGDLTLTAVFAKFTFLVHGRVSASSAGMGTVTPSETTVRGGESIVFRAAPAVGYKFVQWQEDGNEENPRTVTVTQDTTLTAVFEMQTFMGSGSAANPYLISSKDDMELLADNVNGGQHYSGLYFRLTRDLTGANDTLTTSVGNNNTTYFSGIFDGEGHKIAVKRTGIFGRIRNATIKNLGVTGSIHTYSYSYTDSYVFQYYYGGICGITENSTINNCYNNAEIAIPDPTTHFYLIYTGGICGENAYSYIINCHKTGNISSPVYESSKGGATGGITGRYEGGTITNCYNTGNIAAFANSGPEVGGISGGGHEGTITGGTITNCYNTGNIAASGSHGGISGRGGIITNCYNTGNISSSASDAPYAGGICGYQGIVLNCFVAGTQITTNDISLTSTGRIGGDADGRYADCYANGVSANGSLISGTDENGKNGRDATLADLQNQSWLTTTLGWDFTYNWSMTSDGTFPELKKLQILPTFFTVIGAVSESSVNMGTVNPSEAMVVSGEQVVLRATPVEGYHFVEWQEDGSLENPRTVTVTSDMTFTAVFAAGGAETTYTLTVNSNNPDWGTVAVDPAGPYTYGRQVVLTANAVGGYLFVKWDDNVTENPRTVTVIDDMSFEAEFASNGGIPTYTLTVTSNNENWGTVTVNPIGPYTQGQQVVLTPAAVNGYWFVKWDDNTTENPRIVTVTGDMTFTAVFAKENTGETYQITVRSNNANWGSVDGGGRYAEGEEAMLIASPKSGYHFDRWQDKNTENPRLIIVTANETYVAVFAVGLDDTSESPTLSDAAVVVYPNPARNVLYVRSAVAIERVVIRDLSGQQVKQIASPVDREIDVSDLAAGVYLVGITTANGEAIRKIVISD